MTALSRIALAVGTLALLTRCALPEFTVVESTDSGGSGASTALGGGGAGGEGQGAGAGTGGEVIDPGPDEDGDGLGKNIEAIWGTSDRDVDSDDDGIDDGAEDTNHNGVLDDGEFDPSKPDTDDDGFCDGARLDNDDDGIAPTDDCDGQEVIFVGVGTGAADGKSWATAFESIADAVPLPGQQVWIQTGVFKPKNPGDVILILRDDTIVRGGFEGEEKVAAQRGVSGEETILDGDYGNDDDGFTNRSDNSAHVISADGTTGALVERIVVANGDSVTADEAGAGFWIRGSSAVRATSLRFRSNRAPSGKPGGAVYIESGSSLSMEDSVLARNAGNTIQNDGEFTGKDLVVVAGTGSGIASTGPSVTLSNVALVGNQVSGSGGGLVATKGAEISRLLLVGNSATTAGGGMAFFTEGESQNVSEFSCIQNTATLRGGCVALEYGAPTLSRGIVFSNSSQRGGGLASAGFENANITNVSFASNSASTEGGAVYAVSLESIYRQVTFYGNTAPAGRAISITESWISEVSNSVFWSHTGSELINAGPANGFAPTIRFTSSQTLGTANGSTTITSSPVASVPLSGQVFLTPTGGHMDAASASYAPSGQNMLSVLEDFAADEGMPDRGTHYGEKDVRLEAFASSGSGTGQLALKVSRATRCRLFNDVNFEVGEIELTTGEFDGTITYGPTSAAKIFLACEGEGIPTGRVVTLP